MILLTQSFVVDTGFLYSTQHGMIGTIQTKEAVSQNQACCQTSIELSQRLICLIMIQLHLLVVVVLLCQALLASGKSQPSVVVKATTASTRPSSWVLPRAQQQNDKRLCFVPQTENVGNKQDSSCSSSREVHEIVPRGGGAGILSGRSGPITPRNLVTLYYLFYGLNGALGMPAPETSAGIIPELGQLGSPGA